MSIIQDALRRKETPPAGAPAAPPAPPSPPPPPLATSRKAVSPVLLVVLAAVVLGAGGFAVHRSGLLGRFTSKPVAPDAPGEPPPDGPSPATGGGNASAPPVAPDAPATAANAAPESAATNAPMDAPGPVDPPPADTAPAPVAETPTTNAPPATPPRPAIVRWPTFTVRGIIAGRAGTGSVILGKALFDVGQTTSDGLRVVRIVEDGVVLEFRGQERLFRVGTGAP